MALASSLAASLVACHGSPATPSPPQLLPPAAGTVRLTGSVLDGNGNAVPGAQITATHISGSVEALSGAAGEYALPFDSQQVNLPVDVKKDGFEPSRVNVFIGSLGAAADRYKDLRVHQIVRVSAGQSVDLLLRDDDPVCRDPVDEFDWPCRRVRFVSPTAGRLIVVPVQDPTNAAGGPAIRMQLAGRPDVFPPTALNVAVGAGSETIVEVLLISNEATRAMTLHTSLSR